MPLTSRRTVMGRYKPQEIVANLRQVNVLVSQGQNMVDAIRQIGVSEVTYYRWLQEIAEVTLSSSTVRARAGWCGASSSGYSAVRRRRLRSFGRRRALSLCRMPDEADAEN